MSYSDYNLIMKDSIIRNSWLGPTVERIAKRLAGRNVPQRVFDELQEKLSYYPVEDGVAINMMPKIPEDKEVIFTASVFDEDMIVAFGPNRNQSGNNMYTIVITFKYKPLSEVLKVNRDGFAYVLNRRGIILSDETIGQIPGGKLRVKLHENGKSFSMAVKNSDGKWFEQTPDEKGSFVPNRIIAKLVDDTFHVHAPNKRCKPHQRIFEIEE